MAPESIAIMGIFPSDRAAAAAIHRLHETRWTILRVQGPIPSHAVLHALKQPKSRVGLYTLVGGITGFISGYSLAAFASARWSLIVGGKTIVALIPFFIVGFEFTILFSVFGNVLGLLSEARMPRFGTPPHYDIRFTGDRFGVLASCPLEEKQDLTRFFEENGAEIPSAER